MDPVRRWTFIVLGVCLVILSSGGYRLLDRLMKALMVFLAVCTAIAVVAGSVIFLQLPLFGANFGVGWPVFLGGVTLATLVIYAFVTFCSLYPAWLATRIQPATALQYE